MFNHKNQRSIFYPALLTAYIISGIFLLKFYRYQISPDGVSYIEIAQKYASGDFYNAVNGFWSPLLSWLTALFIRLGSEPLYAVKITGFLTGIFALFGLRRLLGVLKVSAGIQKVLLFCAIPLFHSYYMTMATPDFLAAVILLFYLNSALDSDSWMKTGSAVKCGLLGAFAYFAKGYAFPFFLSHFTAVSALKYFFCEDTPQRREAVFSWGAGCFIFFLVVSPWIWAVSAKYGQLTISTAGGFNHAVAKGICLHQPVLKSGFVVPEKGLSSAWEEPSKMQYEKWPALSALQIVVILRNIVVFTETCVDSCLPSIPVFMAVIVILAGLPLREMIKNKAFLIVTSAVLYSAGYMLFHMDSRYLLIVFIIAIALSGYIAEMLAASLFLTPARRFIFFALIACAFLFDPLVSLYHSAGVGRQIYEEGAVLKDKLNISGNVASDSKWSESLISSHYAGAVYFGAAGEDKSCDEIDSELKRIKIDYYVAWDKKTCAEMLSGYRALDTDAAGIKDYKIYRIE